MSRGARTSAEVLGLTPHALWILVGGKEYMLDFARFPWFRAATIADVCDFTVDHGYHLHWPRLDVDLHLESLEHPERFPPISKERAKRPPTEAARAASAKLKGAWPRAPCLKVTSGTEPDGQSSWTAGTSSTSGLRSPRSP